MKVLTAKVRDGCLDVPEGSFQEGETVTVLLSRDREPFEVTADEKAQLLKAIAEAERGEVVDGWALLRDIRI